MIGTRREKYKHIYILLLVSFRLNILLPITNPAEARAVDSQTLQGKLQV